MAAQKEYDRTNKFSIWSSPTEGGDRLSGTINVSGDEFSVKLLRLTKETGKAYMVVEDKNSEYCPVGGGMLYPSKFEGMFLSGKLNIEGVSYYVNLYNGNRTTEKAPIFYGSIKPVDETKSSKPKAPIEDSSEQDEW